MSEQHSETQNSSTQNNTSNDNQQDNNQPSREGTGFWSTVKSVVGAMFGVQSEAQRQKDFEKGSALHFIIGGLVFTIVFIFTILYFVNSALENAGQ